MLILNYRQTVGNGVENIRGKLSNGECVMLAVVLVVIGPYFFSQPIIKQENVLNLS